MTASSAALITRAALALALAWWPAPAGADHEPKPMPAQEPGPTTPPPAEARVADEIARYLTLTRPGPEHRWLEPLAGSWRVELRWEVPERQPALLTGTSENRFILDGRFLQCETAVGEGPSRVAWITLYGFDVAQRKFFAVALSNLAGRVLQATGSYDPAAAGFLLSGRERDDATGALLTYREQLSIEGLDRHVLRVYYDLPGRPPLKAVEAVYTRR